MYIYVYVRTYVCMFSHQSANCFSKLNIYFIKIEWDTKSITEVFVVIIVIELWYYVIQ